MGTSLCNYRLLDGTRRASNANRFDTVSACYRDNDTLTRIDSFQFVCLFSFSVCSRTEAPLNFALATRGSSLHSPQCYFGPQDTPSLVQTRCGAFSCVFNSCLFSPIICTVIIVLPFTSNRCSVSREKLSECHDGGT